MRHKIYYLLSVAFILFIIASCAKKAAEPAKKEEPGLAGKIVITERETATPPAEEAKAPEAPAGSAISAKPITEERVLFNFEEDLEGWEIPDWALEKDDHVAKSAELSKDVASEGSQSLKVVCDFPGQRWTAAVLELEQYLDLSPYREIAVDIYTPPDTPLGLKAKIILTVGEGWTFTEMTRTVPLVPGEWTVVNASLEPGTYDWKKIIPDESFREDVRKIVVRIESNKRPAYKGPIYIDNMRIGK